MTQEQQEEVTLLKELIADKSISADEREIYEDALNQLMKSEKPKATTQRKARTTPTKKVAPAKTKQTATDIEKAKAEIKNGILLISIERKEESKPKKLTPKLG